MHLWSPLVGYCIGRNNHHYIIKVSITPSTKAADYWLPTSENMKDPSSFQNIDHSSPELHNRDATVFDKLSTTQECQYCQLCFGSAIRNSI